MTHFVDRAKALAADGFRVFPLVPGSKKPAIKGWPDKAAVNPACIDTLWADRPYNIGIFTGIFGNGALLVVDVDGPGHGKGTKDGNAEVLRLDIAGKSLPPTREHSTPTGGRHLIYSVSAAVRQGVDVLGPGLDIRSAGGFIVAPGSVVEAGTYYVDGPAPIAPAPQWLIDACGAPRARSTDRTPLPGVDPERALQRATAYLAFDAPEAVEGAGGDSTTYAVAAKLLALGLDEASALDIMLSEHWHDGCGWTPDELAAKVAHAARYMHEPRGAEAPEAVFDAAPAEAPGSAALHPFDTLNAEYAFVIAGGGHHILWETIDAKGNATVEHLKEDTFHKKFAARTFQAGDKPTPLTKAWMGSDRRRSYDALVFRPECNIEPRFYNTWRGFTVAPVAPEQASARAHAAVDAWREHIRENVCSGNAKHAAWLGGYFAHMVQRPWEKPLTALVFRGKKGTGKNAATDRVGQLFRGNYFTAANRRYLTSNFNSHLESCLMLVLDEACWAGDKTAEGILKDLITGAEHLIERKGAEAYKVDNLARVIVIGNERWLVPASEDERRYAVFDVGDGRKQQRAWFREMREGMEADDGQGYGLLLHYLRSIDLAAVDVDDAPRTKGLARQKIESLSPLHQWLLDCLIEGQVLGGDFAGQWPKRADTQRFQDASRRYVRDRGVRQWAPTKQAFNADMKRVFPAWSYAKYSAVYEYDMPPLDEARGLMGAFLGDPDLFSE